MVRSAEGSPRLVGVWFLLAAQLAACSGAATAPAASNAGSPLTVSVAGKLALAGQFADVAVSQGAYAGPFTFQSSDGRVLYVTAIASPRPDLHVTGPFPAPGVETYVSKNGAARIAVLGGGRASIEIVGKGGIPIGPSELQNVVIPEVGSPVFHPKAIRFKTPQSTPFRFTLTQENYVGLAVLISDCPYVASIVQASPPPIGAKVNVRYYWIATPLGPGSCEAIFSGGFKSGRLTISVGS